MLNRQIKTNDENLKRAEIKDDDKVDTGLGEDDKVLIDIQDNTYFLLN